MGIFSSLAERLINRLGYIKAKPDDIVRQELRQHVYAMNQMLYDGSAYNKQVAGGALEEIFGAYIGPSFSHAADRNPIHPIAMPFAEIVETYQYVLPGTWGNGISIAPTIDGSADGKKVNTKLIAAMAKLWSWSNFDTEKSKSIRWSANFGTVGMRITTLAESATRPARVAMGIDHPDRLFNFEEDAEGNVVAVCLKYVQQMNVNTGRTRLTDPRWQGIKVVEVITKDEFSRTEENRQIIGDDARENNLGFCPYVVHKHKDNGTPFGDWSYKGTEYAIHRLNWRISRQDKSIDRNQFARWFATAGGGKPQEIQMGEDSGSYVETKPGTPPPTLEAIVANVDQMAIKSFWMEIGERIRSRQPELNLNAMSLMANLTGETIAQLLKPTEKCIEDVRPGYVHAYKRLMQMGVSAGIMAGSWDVGTGVGTAEAADTAFRDGDEEFSFRRMPSLPPTAYQVQQQAAADQSENQARLQTSEMQISVGLPMRYVWVNTLNITDPAQLAIIDQQKRDEAQLAAATGTPNPTDATANRGAFANAGNANTGVNNNAGNQPPSTIANTRGTANG